MSKVEISVTIASYNTKELTLLALKSIVKALRNYKSEIIVVDNASVDDTPIAISSEFPEVILIKNTNNVGFGSAHNQAIIASSGEYVLILNSDAIVSDDAIKQLHDQCTHPSVGAVGPKVIGLDGVLDPSFRRTIIYSRTSVIASLINKHLLNYYRFIPRRFIQRNLGTKLGSLHDNLTNPLNTIEVEWLDGMCVLFKRKALVTTGLFDEQFFLDAEIGDLMLRLKKNSWDIMYCPKATIQHLKGQSKQGRFFVRLENINSLIRYYGKHKPEYVAAITHTLKSIYRFKYLTSFILSGILSSQRQSKEESSEILHLINDLRDCDPVGESRVTKLAE